MTKWFGAVLLLLAACGARTSSRPMLADSPEAPSSPFSSGPWVNPLIIPPRFFTAELSDQADVSGGMSPTPLVFIGNDGHSLADGVLTLNGVKLDMGGSLAWTAYGSAYFGNAVMIDAQRFEPPFQLRLEHPAYEPIQFEDLYFGLPRRISLTPRGQVPDPASYYYDHNGKAIAVEPTPQLAMVTLAIRPLITLCNTDHCVRAEMDQLIAPYGLVVARDFFEFPAAGCGLGPDTIVVAKAGAQPFAGMDDPVLTKLAANEFIAAVGPYFAREADDLQPSTYTSVSVGFARGTTKEIAVGILHAAQAYQPLGGDAIRWVDLGHGEGLVIVSEGKGLVLGFGWNDLKRRLVAHKEVAGVSLGGPICVTSTGS